MGWETYRAEFERLEKRIKQLERENLSLKFECEKRAREKAELKLQLRKAAR